MFDYKNEFLLYLTDVKKASNNTIQSYIRDIDSFLNFLNSFKIKPEKVTSEVVKQYSDSLSAMGKSNSTVTRVLSSVRCFYRFLKTNGIVDEMPKNYSQDVKAEKKLPEILSSKEIEIFLNAPDTRDMKGLRDKAMLELLYATGIRVSELINIRLDDINFELKILRCRNTKSERIIPVYDEALQLVFEYITKVRPALVFENSEDTLFTNMNGTPMTRQGFWKIVKQYSKSAGISKDITPHTLRHSFAAHLLENGANINVIKDMLGHSDISSTNIYTKVLQNQYSSKYSNEYMAFHPKAKRA